MADLTSTEVAPAYLPFFQTTYGQAHGYNERARSNARVFENRAMHATWRGSYKLNDLSAQQIASPLKSSYNPKIPVAVWPKPKLTYTLPEANPSGAGAGGQSSAAPPQSPPAAAAALSASGTAWTAAGSTLKHKLKPSASFSSSYKNGSGSGSGSGSSSGGRPQLQIDNKHSETATSGGADSARSGNGSARSAASPRPASANAAGTRFVDVPTVVPASSGGSAAAAAAATANRNGGGGGGGAPVFAISSTLSADDVAKLQHYQKKWGGDLTYHSTSRPDIHYHQNVVRVRNRVRPDNDPLNQNRLEAEANWDKWSISRFHRGLTTRVPGYTGHVPRTQFTIGETYGRATRMAFGGPRDDGKRPVTPISKEYVRASAPATKAPNSRIDWGS